jgi:8-oxo-dGTP diphosphatase
VTRRGAPSGPKLTVDAWTRDRRGRILLVRRGRPPFQGQWAFPGGFCEVGETTEESCAREVREETGVRVRVGGVRGVYSDPKRDPRGHTVSILYDAVAVEGKARGGDDAAEARWFSRRDLRRLDLAFDHGRIVREQLARRPPPAPVSPRPAPPKARPPRRARHAAARG